MAQIAQIAKVAGTLCYFPFELQNMQGDHRNKYSQRKVMDLKTAVDEHLQKFDRIVWVDCGGRVKAFHPATPISEVRKKVDELVSQLGLGL